MANVYNSTNITNQKQFNRVVSAVFKGIAERNNQIQQLLMLAVNEAAREAGGQVTNNLDWLTHILVVAEHTKGINLKKMVTYVREVLCCNTITWNSEKNRISKKADKTVRLKYNLEPDTTWFDYGKKDTVKQAFDYGKRLTSSVNSAMDETKGGLTAAEVLAAVIASDKITLRDLMESIEALAPAQAA